MEETRVLTIVFTDIKGFTERTSSSDRESVSRLLQKHEELLLPFVSAYEGKLIKTIGDAFLLSFASPTNAVLCAVMMQEKLKEFNFGLNQSEKIEIRIAINTGEVLLRDGDVFGEPVNIAARIEGLTEANEVWFSESTYLAMNRKEVPTSLIGDYRLKGIPEAIKIYRVLRDENDQGYVNAVQNQLERIKTQLLADRMPKPTAKAGYGRFYLAAAMIIMALFFVFRETKHEKFLRQAEEARKRSEFKAEIEALKNAVHAQPGEIATLKLLSAALDRYVAQKLAITEPNLESIVELENYLRETRNIFPALPEELLPSEINLALARARLLAVAAKRKDADLVLDKLAERCKGRSQVLFQIGEHYHKFGYNWPRTIRFLHAAAVADPIAYATNTIVIENFKWLFDSFPPSRGYEEVRTFVMQNCFSEFEARLRDALYSQNPEHHSLRWNAADMLAARGEKIDMVKLYLTDLLTSPGNRDSVELQKICEFFQQNSGPAMGLQIEEALKGLPESFPLFKTYLFERSDAPMKIVAGPLFLHLQAHLRTLLQAESINTRINAFTALKMRNALQPEEIWNFSLRSIVEFRMMQWSAAYQPTLLEALDFSCKNSIPAALWESPEFKTAARKAAGAVAAMIEQDQQAEKNKTEKLYIKLDMRSQEDLEALIKKLDPKVK